MKTKTALCSLMLISTLLSTGCWDRTEMNDLALVMASGYDLDEKGQLQATLQIALPTSGAQGNSGKQTPPFIVQSMSGDTVHDAMVKIQERMSRKLYEGHRRVIVIGEKLARHGIKQLLDQFSRDPYSRFRSYIIVAKNMEASELLQKQYPFERVPAEAIRELEKSRVGFETTLRDYLIEVVNEGIEPIMGVIEPIQSTSSHGTNAVESKETFHLTGTALFQDLKLVGYLNSRETRALLWVKGERPQGIFTAPIPDTDGHVSVELHSQESKISTEFNNEHPTLKVKIIGTAAVHENGTDLNLSKPQNMERIERAMEASVIKRVHNVIRKAQGMRQDIFGFGREIHRHDRPYWKQIGSRWADLFAKADIQVEVHMRLIEIGMSRAPLQHTQQEGNLKQ